MEEKKEDTLWDNPMVRSAMKSMTIEQRKEYETIGKKMYGDINFNNVSNPEEKIEDVKDYLCELLKSGLHPSDMTENEQFIMASEFGQDWYKKWGYTQGDLKEIITLKK